MVFLNMSPTYSTSTGLLLAFAGFVIYIRAKNWVESNVPLFFYVAIIAYMNAVGGTVPLWLMFTSFAFTLLLRFEFMNPAFTNFVKILEICSLSVIIYLGLKMIF